MAHYLHTTQVLEGENVLEYGSTERHLELSNARHFNEEVLAVAFKVVVNEVHDRVKGRTVGRGGVELKEPAAEVDADADDHLVGSDGEGEEMTGIVAVSEEE